MATNHTNPSQRYWGSQSMGHRDGMSDEQAHRLKALCWQRGERFDSSLTAAEAERRIAELERAVKAL
ncbi:MAG: hypothetical protein H7Y60_03660 [Rhodospirillaceae bacterium]|nr:hypothetical protein [Rhodospirillales bacterium]